MTHILIVDDKEENLYYLQALLTGNGYTVDAAYDGVGALARARHRPPDLVISDLLMPVMDGYTLLRHWKADARLKGVPFILYTATYTEPEDERLALSLGADAFILKPAEPDDFLASIRDMQGVVAAAVSLEPKQRAGDEVALLQVYNATLIHKLEEKTLKLEQANRLLELDAIKHRQFSRRLMEVEEHERKRLGMELHDQVGANLSALVLCLELIRCELPPSASGALVKRISDFEAVLHDTMGHVRSVLEDLRPPGLEELGLVGALRHQASVLTSRHNVEFAIQVLEPIARLRPECEIAFFRIAQEAWTNVLKHAQAHRVVLTLGRDGAAVFMEIKDDGKGFVMQAGSPTAGGLGLATMRERAEAMGATLELHSALGAGVRLRLSLGGGNRPASG